MSQSMMQLADIKPGHPIWDEVWERSRPGGTNHINQLFEAKIELAKLRADNKALLDAAKYVIERAELIASWGGTIDCRYVLDEMDLTSLRAAIEHSEPQ